MNFLRFTIAEGFERAQSLDTGFSGFRAGIVVSTLLDEVLRLELRLDITKARQIAKSLCHQAQAQYLAAWVMPEIISALGPD